jgi:hypothetical protein
MCGMQAAVCAARRRTVFLLVVPVDEYIMCHREDVECATLWERNEFEGENGRDRLQGNILYSAQAWSKLLPLRRMWVGQIFTNLLVCFHTESSQLVTILR